MSFTGFWDFTQRYRKKRYCVFASFVIRGGSPVESAVEQSHPQSSFQTGNSVAECRRRNLKLSGGSTEAAVTRDSNYRLEINQSLA
jgi:hypothetical protein